MTPIDGFATMRDTAAMLIYKIFRADEWAHLQAKGETAGAPIDVQDGYVHFSTAEQAAETPPSLTSQIDARRHHATNRP